MTVRVGTCQLVFRERHRLPALDGLQKTGQTARWSMTLSPLVGAQKHLGRANLDAPCGAQQRQSGLPAIRHAGGCIRHHHRGELAGICIDGGGKNARVQGHSGKHQRADVQLCKKQGQWRGKEGRMFRLEHRVVVRSGKQELCDVASRTIVVATDLGQLIEPALPVSEVFISVNDRQLFFVKDISNLPNLLGSFERQWSELWPIWEVETRKKINDEQGRARHVSPPSGRVEPRLPWTGANPSDAGKWSAPPRQIRRGTHSASSASTRTKNHC